MHGEYLYRDTWRLLTGPIPDFGTVGRFPLVRVVSAWGAVLVVLVAVLVATGLATIAAWVPLGGERSLVIRGAWPQGQVPAGERVVATISQPPADIPPAVWDVTFGTQPVLEATVLGTTTSLTTIKAGKPIYRAPGGEVLPLPSGQGDLTNTYLATCERGECAPGELLIIPYNHILGKAS